MSNIDKTDDASDNMQDYVPEEDSTEEVEETSVDNSETESETQEAPTEEQPEPFTESFDPKNLPEELVPAYKQMQADYTRKTQGIAEERNLANEYRKNEALITFLRNNPQLMSESVLAGNQTAQQPSAEPEIPQDPKAYAEWVKEQSRQDAEALYNQKFEAFAKSMAYENQVQEAERLDPRLQSDPVFARSIASMVMVDQDVSSGRKSVVDATRQYIADYDASLKKAIAAEKAKLTKEAQAKAKPSIKGSPQSTVQNEKMPESMRDAMPAEFR